MKAFLKNYRQSPRKVRLVANLVKGKTVDRALAELEFLPKRAGEPIAKLISSATSNALAGTSLTREMLKVKDVRVDKGIVMKRRMPRAFGRAYPINKRTSHLLVVLEDVNAPKAAKAAKK